MPVSHLVSSLVPLLVSHRGLCIGGLPRATAGFDRAVLVLRCCLRRWGVDAIRCRLTVPIARFSIGLMFDVDRCMSYRMFIGDIMAPEIAAQSLRSEDELNLVA